jgi:hypothetical protein
MLDEPLLIVVAAGRRYAVAQQDVQALQRIDSAHAAVTFGALLGVAPDDDAAPYALTVATAANDPMLVRVQRADLRSDLARLPLPAWIAALAHPAVAGLALDGADLLPLVDLVQLAHQTGRETT